MRLKVELFLNDFADRCGTLMAQSSKIFTTWISFPYHKLTLLFPFPSKAKIDKLMLSEFACYPSTRNIMDYAFIYQGPFFSESTVPNLVRI